MAIWENNLFKTIIIVATSRATLWKIVLLLFLHLVTLVVIETYTKAVVYRR